ncbi:MAG: sigma-70 family RNA polymerase sigma factor [Myxococcales bacterium]|nr:sigma-70 family RNA polymerase sigma factor [Myxococcales bacterium]
MRATGVSGEKKCLINVLAPRSVDEQRGRSRPIPERAQAAAEHVRWIRQAIKAHQANLLRYARRIVGDDDRARDVVQDAFFRLCEAERATVEGHVGPWLFRVTRNRALDIMRKDRPMRLQNDAAERLSSNEPSPSTLAERKQSLGRALAMLETLPEKQREVVQLKFQHGLSYREISEVTGLTVGYVGNLMHHAMRALRDKLSDTDNATGSLAEATAGRLR